MAGGQGCGRVGGAAGVAAGGEGGGAADVGGADAKEFPHCHGPRVLAGSRLQSYLPTTGLTASNAWVRRRAFCVAVAWVSSRDEDQCAQLPHGCRPRE